MNLVIKGKNVDLTPALRDYVEKKLGRIERYSDHIQETSVELSVHRNPRIADNQIVEVTIYAHGAVIRGEEAASDMYAAIDLVTDKIERQLKKYEQRKSQNNTGKLKTSIAVANAAAAEEAAIEQAARQIVRSKRHDIQPMRPEEAAAQMDMLGHNFYAFRNEETDEINIVYHRRDGDYGVIEPENSVV